MFSNGQFTLTQNGSESDIILNCNNIRLPLIVLNIKTNKCYSHYKSCSVLW